MSSETFNWAWATTGGGLAQFVLVLASWLQSDILCPRKPEPQEVLLTGSSFMKTLLETCIKNNTLRALRGKKRSGGQLLDNCAISADWG